MDFVTCDRCGAFWCQHHAPGPAAEQRAGAKREGWRITRGADICTECVEEEAAPDHPA